MQKLQALVLSIMIFRFSYNENTENLLLSGRLKMR